MTQLDDPGDRRLQPGARGAIPCAPGAAAPPGGSRLSVESYLAVLDSVLEDRRVTATEAESLRDLAVSLGVGADAAIAAHQMYLRALAVAAWADGVITDAEYADLGEVARLLGFPPLRLTSSWPPPVAWHSR